MKDRVFSCDIEVNGKKVENNFVKLLISAICIIIVLIPLVLMAFGILHLLVC